MASCGSKSRCCYEVVARSREKVKARCLQAVAIFENTTYRSTTAFLRASQSLVLKCRDTTSLVAWGWILANWLTMREEVVLEIIDERNCLIEELTVLATVHKDCLCTEHFWYLGEDACAALSYEPVGEFALKWVGGNARESVRATAFKTYAEFTYWNINALVLLAYPVHLTENVHAVFNLVTFNLLCHNELDALLVIVAKHSHEVIRLIVLASEGENEHGTCI